MNSLHRTMNRFALPLLLMFLLSASVVWAQDTERASDAKPKQDQPAQDPEQPTDPDAVAPSAKIEITDEPKMVDPALLIPKKLMAKTTVTFDEASLSEVAKWIQDKQEIGVIIDTRALDDEGILTSEPITDALKDEPLYLLLDRLNKLDLQWYWQNDNIYISTVSAAEDHLTTQNYNVGDLFDAGHDADTLVECITSTVAPASWDEVGGQGSTVVLGDVLFIRQTDAGQRQVAGLLEALRDHSRRTFTNDTPQNETLRKKLDENVTVELIGVPLADAVKQLAAAAKADIRLDRISLEDVGVRSRTPVQLEMEGQKLRTVLMAMLKPLGLSWSIQDGVMWIVSQEEAESELMTAVYDVRDLCRDASESDALAAAITSQTSPEDWEEVGGYGSLEFPLPGTLVVSQTGKHQEAVLSLLENYRIALRQSKPRERDIVDPKEIIVRYYRLPASVANDLQTALPQLVAPTTWKSQDQPKAEGTILKLASKPELQDANGYSVKGNPSETGAAAVMLDYAVLIIRQSREVHDQIPEILNRVQNGDMQSQPFGGGGGGLGGGGFGGGFF